MSMRTVMDIGGSCGSGGPYEIAPPCPGNVAGILPGAIWGGSCRSCGRCRTSLVALTPA